MNNKDEPSDRGLAQGAEATRRSDMDGGWKQIIEDYFEEFLRFYFPKIHAQVDFEKGYEYLDKDLDKLTAEAVVKILDHKTEAELIADPSPMAVVSLIQLKQIEAGSSARCRFETKVAQTRALLTRRGLNEQDIRNLFRFLDFLFRLPNGLEADYRDTLRAIEEEIDVPYMTSIERLARQEGLEEGRQEGVLEGLRTSVVQVLVVRFGEVPDPLRQGIDQCNDADSLRTFLKKILTADSLEKLQF